MSRGRAYGLFPLLYVDDLYLLGREVSNDEIKSALFEMQPWKAPGIDGFQAVFFQNFWTDIGDKYVIMLEGYFWDLRVCMRLTKL